MCCIVTSSETSKVAREMQFSPCRAFLPHTLLLFDVRNTDLAPQWVIANKHWWLLLFILLSTMWVSYLVRFSFQVSSSILPFLKGKPYFSKRFVWIYEVKLSWLRLNNPETITYDSNFTILHIWHYLCDWLEYNF